MYILVPRKLIWAYNYIHLLPGYWLVLTNEIVFYDSTRLFFMILSSSATQRSFTNICTEKYGHYGTFL